MLILLNFPRKAYNFPHGYSPMFLLHRLEDQCTEFLADNIEAMAENTDLHRMIEEDAGTVKDRQETDSIH